MIPISSFTLEPIPRRKESEPYQSRLLFDERPVVSRLRGVVLEGQFQCDGAYLLLLTEDVPYEEGLYIYLLSPAWEILDELVVGFPYTPGVLSDVRIVADDQLEFSFFGKDRWRLTVSRTPSRMRLGRMASGAKRPVGRIFSKHYLELTCLDPGV